MSYRGTARRVHLPTTSLRSPHVSRVRKVAFDPETRIVPPSPRSEEPSPHVEEMEERPKTPFAVSSRLPASADPNGVSAIRTRRLAAPDRTSHHAFPVTFRRDACTPFRSRAGVTRLLCAKVAHRGCVPCRTPQPVLSRDRAPRNPRQRACGLRRASPPSCALPCDRARSESGMRSDRLLASHFHRLRAPASRPFSASLRSLRSAPSPRGLRPCVKETEGHGVSHRPARFGGPARFAYGLLVRSPLDEPNL